MVDGKGDYLLSVKGNQAGLEADIEDYVQDDSLLKSMDTGVQKEKHRGRLEMRTAFNIAWLPDREKWLGLCCIGAIHTEFEEAVESMHWLLDVHFGEDFCRIEDKAVQPFFSYGSLDSKLISVVKPIAKSSFFTVCDTNALLVQCSTAVLLLSNKIESLKTQGFQGNLLLAC